MIDPGAANLEVRAGVVGDFARSALFERTFQDGMSLVEDTAAYLDGAGRQESRLMSKTVALAYASESMRLTTQLMQVASWLLVQRAVREGDMAAREACETRYRMEPQVARAPEPGAEALPPGLVSLMERTRRLHERVSHLDHRMYRQALGAEADHPVAAQMERLRAAFGS